MPIALERLSRGKTEVERQQIARVGTELVLEHPKEAVNHQAGAHQ